jgi:hypothetical protein
MGFGEQRLPLPVGSPHPIRQPRRVFRGGPGLERTVLSLGGMLAAAIGALLTAFPITISAGVDESSYRVGEVRLESRGSGVYSGAAGALVLVEDPGGALAGASTHVGGQRMVGNCRMAVDGRSERCWFRLGSRTLTAEDRLQNGGWERLYDDGGRIRIALQGGGPFPVPFAVGR